MLMTAIEGILGVEATYSGLRIRPCLPDGWESASIERPYREDTYVITYERPGGTGNTVQSLELDGVAVDGDLVPFVGDRSRHEVRVKLGPAS
jgi:cellobiose phosphorylase